MWANLIWCGKWKSCMMYHISNKNLLYLGKICPNILFWKFLRNFPGWTRYATMAIESCKKTRELPDRFSSLIGQKKYFWSIRSRQFKRFWKWLNKIKCPRARLDLTVNSHHEHFIDPTNCPWVSEDGDQYHVVIRHLLFLPSSVMILLSFLSCFLVPCVYFIAWLRLSLNYNQFRVLQAVDSLNVKHELWSKRVTQLISCSVSRRHSKRYFLVCHLKIVFYFLHKLKGVVTSLDALMAVRFRRYWGSNNDSK